MLQALLFGKTQQHISIALIPCRFRKGLPSSLIKINEECLAMQEADYFVSQPSDEMVEVIKHAMYVPTSPCLV
jgi:hypothetical protein